MATIEVLQQQLTTLEAQIQKVKQEGGYLTGVRIERTPAGGTASQTAKETCRYARLRAGRGKLLPNGKKSLYVPVEKISEYEAACDRGKRIQQLERQAEQLRSQIRQVEQAQYRSWSGTPRRTAARTVKPTQPSPQLAVEENSPLEPIVLEPPPAPTTSAGILVLYRQHREAPVHAVAAEVWQGNQKIAEIGAVHCLGLRADKVTAYIKSLLESLHQQFGIVRFEDVVKELPVTCCPITPCPLKETTVPQP